MSNGSQQIRRTYAAGALIGVVFLACSLLLLRQIGQQTERENALYLYDTINQLHALFQRQITMDFQILRGVAITLAHAPRDKVMPILKEVNDNNEFMRMGLASPDGRVDLVDIDGSLHRDVDLAGEKFFQDALTGEAGISGLRDDPFGRGVIACSVMPVRTDGRITGVLVAVNAADVFLDILATSLFDDRGISSLINAEGAFVLRREPDGTAVLDGKDGDIFRLGQMEKSTPAHVLADLRAGRRGVFFYEAHGQRRFAAFEPLGVNNWFLFCSVPVSALALGADTLLYSAGAIIGLAALLFFFLFWRVHSIGHKHRRELERLAFVDPLTGGRNFNRLKLDAATLLQRNPDQRFAVWHADIKNLKFYNEMFGCTMGDKELARIAGLFEQGDGALSLSCRVSADEFAGIRPMQSREAFSLEFQRLAERIKNGAARPSRSFPLVLHMGVYSSDMAPRGGITFVEMSNRANIALREARESSSGPCVFYSEDMRGAALRLLDIEARMDTALADGEFEIWFQPKVDIQHGNRINGAEALARWRNGGRLIPPGEFIPLFAQNGFLIRLDRHMFALACAWLQKHLQAGPAPLNIAINVSRLSLLQDDFFQYYTNVKECYGIPDGLLELECAESLTLFDESFRELILALQEHGFRCSLDDFGAGFSSLNVLKELPIDALKLDIPFLRNSRDQQRERIVISNIIAMARELGIKTVAEGVEEPGQVDFLRAKGCDSVQGFVFARPMPAAEFSAMLTKLQGGPVPLTRP